MYVPRLLCGGGGRRPWYTLFAHALSSLGNGITGLDCGLDCWTGLMDWITGFELNLFVSPDL